MYGNNGNPSVYRIDEFLDIDRYPIRVAAGYFLAEERVGLGKIILILIGLIDKILISRPIKLCRQNFIIIFVVLILIYEKLAKLIIVFRTFFKKKILARKLLLQKS